MSVTATVAVETGWMHTIISVEKLPIVKNLIDNQDNLGSVVGIIKIQNH
jgi:hypothetical protein